MRVIPWFAMISCGFCILLAGCERHAINNEPSQSPATLAKIPGSPFKLVTLTAEAAKKVGIELVPLKEVVLPGNAVIKPILIGNMTQVPYSALIYGLHGETWVYTLVKSLTFVRREV